MDISAIIKNGIVDLKTLGSLDGWFQASRQGLSVLDFGFVFLSLLVLAGAVVFWICARKQERIMKAFLLKWRNTFFWVGFLGLVWASLRREFVGVFGTRAAAAVLLLALFLRIAFLLREWKRKVVLEQKEWQEKTLKSKYLNYK